MSLAIDLIQPQLMIRFWWINHPGHNPLLDHPRGAGREETSKWKCRWLLPEHLLMYAAIQTISSYRGWGMGNIADW
jgi:hypothetical protein